MSDLDQQTCSILKKAEEGSVGEGTQVQSSASRSVGGEGQFPANQLKVSSELVGRTALQFTVNADPRNPETVPPGRYCGQIVVQRQKGESFLWDLVVRLDDREAAAPVVAALWWLLLGALVGIAVRFANDPLAGLVPLQQQQRELTAWLARERSKLSPDVVRRFEAGLATAEAAILNLAPEAARRSLGELEQHRAEAEEEAKAPKPQRAGNVDEHQAHPSATAASRDNVSEGWPGDRGIIPGMLRHYWMVTAALSLIVAIAAGLKTQYFDQPKFDGALSDWFQLAVFAFAFQVTATTLVDAAVRLSPAGVRGPSTGSPQGTPQ